MRLILFILFLFIIFSSIWLSLTNQNNIIVLELLDYHIEISIVLATIAILVFLTGFFYFIYILLFIQNIPQIFRKYYHEKQDHQDLNLLLEGFASLYQEDPDLNRQFLKKIKSHKNDQTLQAIYPVVALFIAQSNLVQFKDDPSNIEALEDSYMNLLQYEEMKITALKGLIELRMNNKRFYDALIYAEKAFAIEPKLPWLIKSLIKIYSELGMYEKTDYITHKALGYKIITKEESNTIFINNFLAHTHNLIANSQVEMAIEIIEKVLKIDPAHYEAIVTLVELEGNDKSVYKFIEKAWKARPSIELAKLLYNKSRNEPLKKRIKLLENLIDSNTNAREGYLVLAELYLEEKMLEQAKKIMEQLLALYAPDSRTIKLMALIEAKSHSNHNIIINWLNKL